MEMYDVLSKLKQIENPNEDQARAIENAEKMNNPTNPSATQNNLMPEQGSVSATGENVYQPAAQETPTDYAKLAGVQTLNVQTDAPATNESVETKQEVLSEAEYFVRATDLMNYEMDVEANSEQEAEAKAYDILKSEDKEDHSVGGEGAIVQSVQMYEGVEEEGVEEEVVAEEDTTPEQYDKNEKVEEAKPDFLDLDKDGDKKESMKKAAKDKEEMEESIETIELDEAYDPIHVADIVKKHEKEGHKVQMDRPEGDAQGFTVTFKDGKRRHYKYTQGGAKVQSLEPTDPLVDPNAPKRGKGRPKKESEELNLDSMMEDFEKKYTEQLNEGLQVTQSIDDEGNENVNINANNAHADMVKNLLKLSGMRSDGYKEYEGDPEAVEEERDPEYTNSPREKTTSVDAQVKDMTGGVNGPKPASAAKSNSNPLHVKEDNEIVENMMALYKDYKGS
jgi:hypothetical protein